MDRNLRWLLRRYRDGGSPDWEVAGALTRERTRLEPWFHELRLELASLGGEVSRRLLDCEAALNAALQHEREVLFEPTLEHLLAADAILRDLTRLAPIYQDLCRSEARLAALEVLWGPHLADLATPRCLRRLCALASEFLQGDEPRKARLVALYLGTELDRLDRHDLRAHDKAGDVAQALRALGAQPADGPAVNRLAELLAEGYRQLVSRLAEDLEVELSVRARQAASSGGLGDLRARLATLCDDATALRTSIAAWCATPGDERHWTGD